MKNWGQPGARGELPLQLRWQDRLCRRENASRSHRPRPRSMAATAPRAHVLSSDAYMIVGLEFRSKAVAPE